MQSIYILSDPRTKRVRYVGKSINPHSRHEQHIDEISSSAKGRWIQELRYLGLEPDMAIVLDCDDRDVYDQERYWIAMGKKLGWPLTNSIAPPARWRTRVVKRVWVKWVLVGVGVMSFCGLYVWMFP